MTESQLTGESLGVGVASPLELLRSSPAVRTATSLLVVWALLIAAAGIDNNAFLSRDTVVSVGFSMSIVGVLAVGAAVLLISGGLVDLSVPTSTGMSALVTAAVLQTHGSWLAVGAGVAAGLGIGLLNGLIIVATKLNPIVTTLGVNFAGQGAIDLLFGRQFTRLSSGLHRFALSRLLDLPSIFWLMIALLALTAVALGRTRYGRHTVAVGGNSLAARRQGISLTRVRLATYAFMGLCAGLAGVVYASEAQIISPGDTTSLLFPTIAAVILSGFSLRGGRGSMPVLIVGIGLLATIPTALILVGLSPSWTQFAQGLVLVIALCVDGLRVKRAPGAR